MEYTLFPFIIQDFEIMPKDFLSRKPIDDGFGAKIDNEFSEIDMDIVLDWGVKRYWV